MELSWNNIRFILLRRIIPALCLFVPVGAGTNHEEDSFPGFAGYLKPAQAKHWRWLERDWGTVGLPG